MKIRFRHALVCGLFAACSSVTVGPSRVESLTPGDLGAPYTLAGPFSAPSGVAVDEVTGKLFVSDTANRRLRWAALNTLTAPTVTWIELGYVADVNAADALVSPQGLDVDSQGNLYVANGGKNAINLYRHTVVAGADTYAFDPAFAQTTRSTVGGVAIAGPRDVAVDSHDKIYALDAGNGRILVADGPSDDSWSVLPLPAGVALHNPYGLDFGPNDALYVADTGGSRIVRLLPKSDGTTQVDYFGTYGANDGQLDSPRDVAVMRAGPSAGELYIADTNNQRVQALTAAGNFDFQLAQGPLVSSPQKIAVDASQHVFVVDSALNVVVAFLGTSAQRPFDVYVRDYLGDDGTEPSSAQVTLASPDVIVRHLPDVDPSMARSILPSSPSRPARKINRPNLDGVTSEPASYGEFNYVYLSVRNRGRQAATNVQAQLYWVDPHASLDASKWNPSGFYFDYTDPSTNTPGNGLLIDSIPGTDPVTGSDGVTVVGPLLWLPPSPSTSKAGDGVFDLVVKLTQTYDQVSGSPSDLTAFRASNNLALLPVTSQIRRSALRVRLTGNGPGDVQGGLAAGIDNGLDAASVTCRAGVAGRCVIVRDAALGTANVTITATPTPGQSSFDGWSGACTGSDPTCTVTLDGSVDVSAHFTALPVTPAPNNLLTLALIEGAAPDDRPDWKVTASSGGRTVECDLTAAGPNRGNQGSCASAWPPGATVVLKALSPLPTDSLSWGGDCTVGVVGDDGYQTCTVTLDGDRNVDVTITSPATSCTDDHNPCTDDRWDPDAAVCVHAPKTGVACEQTDACSPGACTASGTCQHTPVTCNSPGPCGVAGTGTCKAGVCSYQTRDCGAGPVCATGAGTCNPANGKCSWPLAAIGAQTVSCRGDISTCSHYGCAYDGSCGFAPYTGRPCGGVDCWATFCGSDGYCSQLVQQSDGTACSAGSCCGGKCVNTKTDTKNCGSCGRTCAASTCRCHKVGNNNVCVGFTNSCAAGSCNSVYCGNAGD